MDFYQEMYDKQLAQTIAGQDRLGIARLIMQQIPGGADTTQSPSAAEPAPQRVIAPAPRSTAHVPPFEATTAAAPAQSTPAGGVLLSRVEDDDFAEMGRIERSNSRWQKPDNFIADIWSDASTAARQLGISPELLVAQAALETGWGRHTMKFDDGRNSYNLFGIKAGGDWRGPTLSRGSLEHRDGILQNQVSRFRAYRSPAHSLSDYVDFIQSNPRYRPALSVNGDDHAYIRAIHDAGYATDPHYADKVIGILGGELLQRTLAGNNSGVGSHG